MIIDNAVSKSHLSEQSAPSTAEQPAAPEVSSSDAEVNADSGGVSSGVGTSAKIGGSKTTASAANSECDSQSILANLPEAELRLLCSLLAREGYELALIDSYLVRKAWQLCSLFLHTFVSFLPCLLLI